MKDKVFSRDFLPNKAKRHIAMLATAFLAACSSDGVKTVQKTELDGSLGSGCTDRVVYLGGTKDKYDRGVVVRFDADDNAISSNAAIIEEVLGQIKNPADGSPETVAKVLIPEEPPKEEDHAICAVPVVSSKEFDKILESK